MDALAHVARRLADLNNDVVFVGGCVVPFLVPAAVAPTIRPTEDVDCVVRATTWIDYHQVEERLRTLGFQICAEEGAPICRWVIDGIRVDVMPAGEEALGFRNQWYDEVFAAPLDFEVDSDLHVKVVNSAVFLATKFEAFAARGHGDYMGSPDFEDIVAVIAFSDNIVYHVLAATAPLRVYLTGWARKLLELPGLIDFIQSCLLPDAVSQEAVPVVLRKLRDIAGEE